MSVFPGDMSIGWGFGLEPQPEEAEQRMRKDVIIAGIGNEQDEPQPTDRFLAVSELEQRLLDLQGQLLNEQLHKIEHLLRIQQVDQRITDLEERLRSLVLVVNTLVIKIETKEGETN